jgi:hypothetical protein
MAVSLEIRRELLYSRQLLTLVRDGVREHEQAAGAAWGAKTTVLNELVRANGKLAEAARVLNGQARRRRPQARRKDGRFA